MGQNTPGADGRHPAGAMKPGLLQPQGRGLGLQEDDIPLGRRLLDGNEAQNRFTSIDEGYASDRDALRRAERSRGTDRALLLRLNNTGCGRSTQAGTRLLGAAPSLVDPPASAIATAWTNSPPVQGAIPLGDGDGLISATAANSRADY